MYTKMPNPASLFSPPNHVDSETIGFHNIQFTWATVTQSVSTRSTSRRSFVLRISEDVQFKRGVLNLVVGPTGSGKTSILLALLGEMHCAPNGAEPWVNLPRNGGIAYCPQEAWVLNETIKVRSLFRPL